MSEQLYNVIDQKLEKLEQKIDKLSEAVLAIARIEERQSQYSRSMERMFNKVEMLEKDVSVLKEKSIVNTQKIGFSERIFWIIVTAAVGVAAWLFRQSTGA